MIRHYEAFAGLRKRAEIQYDRLPEEIKRSQAGKEMYVALHPPAKVRTNDRIADAESVDSNGETHRLSEYLGKYVLLDFWSFGCGPCLLSLPELKAASESYRDRLTVISITSDPKGPVANGLRGARHHMGQPQRLGRSDRQRPVRGQRHPASGNHLSRRHRPRLVGRIRTKGSSSNG